MSVPPSVPVIDVSDLANGGEPAREVSAAIDAACREHGFFSIVGHGVDDALAERVAGLSRQLFALPDSEKSRIAMPLAGAAWRGWFPLGGELTSGRPDRKEGFYVGEEHPPDHPRVVAGVPLHGANLWPVQPVGLREAAHEYLAALTTVGHRLVRATALGLGLDEHALDPLFVDPTVLLRVFTYPPAEPGTDEWGVGEHTDYGFLTILWQDTSGGLEVRTRQGWIDVDPHPGAFVCNVGDMLDRMTAGRYRSAPHRVRNRAGHARISIPFFFDPAWDASVQPLDLPGDTPPDDADQRWDAVSVHGFTGTYGDYLLGKVAKVFPTLHDEVARE